MFSILTGLQGTKQGVVEIAVSEHKIDDACKHICAKYFVSQCGDAGCYPEPRPDYHFHVKEHRPDSEWTIVSLHKITTVLTDLPTQIPNIPKPGDSNYILVTDTRLPKYSGDGSSGNCQRTLGVNKGKSTARILTLARHTESLILRLCLNFDTDNAPVLFKAIEEIVDYYGENTQRTDIWKQLLCDLDDKNDNYGDYLIRQRNEWKHERPNAQSWQDVPMRNLRRSGERQRHAKRLREKLVDDGKLTSTRD